MKWWEKKTPLEPARHAEPTLPAKPILETPMPDSMARVSVTPTPEPNRTLLGPSVTLRGELAGDEDLVIEGQFDGTIDLRAHCLTVGAKGQVKADIQAARAVIMGTVTGNITARERIEIRKTGRVLGDLLAPGIAIEDGAYFKGSIEIQRDDQHSLVTSAQLSREEAADD